MDIILLTKVENLGKLGDVVRVRNGYARNFLIPYGKAKAANKANLADFAARRAELEKIAADAHSAAEIRAAQLEGYTVTIGAKAGTEGKLFGSVGAVEIADAMTASGHGVEKREVRMPNGPLRNVGEFEIVLHLHSDVNTTIKVVVVGEQ